MSSHHQMSCAMLVLAAVSAAIPQVVVSQSSLDLTLDNIYGDRNRARQAVISPDGRWVAVAANGTDGAGIYIVSTEPSEPGSGEFWVAGRSPTWFPGSRRIAFSNTNDLWTIAIGSTEPVRITNDSNDERSPVVAPDGRTVAFYSSRSGFQDIWLVSADDGHGGGTVRQLTREANSLDDPRWAPAWSPDSKQIAYNSNKNEYWEDDVWVVDVETGDTRQVSRALMASSTPVWSPDGESIALLGTSKNGYWYEDLADIWVIDPANDTERTVDMQVYGTDWLHNRQVFWSGDGSQIFFVYHERGDLNLWAVPAAGGVATRVTNMTGSLSAFHATTSGDAFVFVRANPTRGADVDYIGQGGGEVRRLTNFADEWATRVVPQEISYRTFDGLYIQGFLFFPPDMSPGQRLPALVNVHGGGTNSYLRGESLFEQYLATKGYVVLAVNYRGGSGFGREFQDLSINDWANGQARDAAAAADFLRSQSYSNGKVGIYGYSYGGIQTMAAIARVPDAFDAAVPMAGIYDFGDAYTNADRLGKIFIKTGHGGSPEDRPEVYGVSNTLARLQNIETPLLIMHGELDVRAPYAQYKLAVEALTQYGKEFESRSYPGERHGLRPAARIDMYRRLEAFFLRHLHQAPGADAAAGTSRH